MKKLFVLILVLSCFAIGCGNTDPSGGDGNENIGALKKPAGITDAQNEALNEGVKRLGNLDGFAQLFGKPKPTGSPTRRVSKTSTGETYQKVFIKGNEIKIAYATDVDGIIYKQIVEFTLEDEVDTSGFTITLNSHSGSTEKINHAGYKFYNIRHSKEEVKLPAGEQVGEDESGNPIFSDGNWYSGTDTGLLKFIYPKLVKITGDAGNPTGLSMAILFEETDKDNNVIKDQYYLGVAGTTFEESVDNYASY